LLRKTRGGHRVSILAYHEVCTGREEREGVISADRLRRHLRYIKDNFRVVSLRQCVGALDPATALTEDLAVITFDDGYLGNYEFAWPVLRDEGLPATIFVTTAFLDGEDLWFDTLRRALDARACGRQALPARALELLQEAVGGDSLSISTGDALGRIKDLSHEQRTTLAAELRCSGLDLGPASRPLSWDNVRELDAAGIEIGCHSVNHPILSQLSAAEQRNEIFGARDRIASETGTAPTSFAYPNGSTRDYNDTTMAILREAGFDLAVTTARGANHQNSDLLQLRRVSIGSDPNFVLAARLAGLFDEGIRSLLPHRFQHVH